MEMETDEEAVMYGALMACEMVKQMPDITGKGIVRHSL